MKRLISSILAIAMILTMIPAAIAASTDFELKLGDIATYTVEPNGTVDVPVYFKTSDGVTDKLGTLQTYVVIPEGFTAEVVAGSLGANALSVDAANGIVKAMGIIGDGYTNDTPAFTIKFTAPATEGEYAVAYSTAKKYATKLYNRETLEKFDAARYTLTETAIKVKAEDGPVVPPTPSTDFELKLGAQSSYTVEAGQTVDIPVYFITADGVTDKLGTLQTYVVIPEGFTAEVVAGSLGANALSVDAANGIVKAMGIIGDGYTNDTPAFTIKFTAPATAGEYAVAYSTAKKYATKLYNRETLEKFDAARYTLTETAITVVAGQEPPAPEKTLESIAVTPETLTVPVSAQADVKAYVESNIEKVVATYSDNSTEEVTGYTVTVNGNVATVAYEGKEDTIALTMEAPSVVSIAVSPKTLTVPVSAQADIKAFVESKIEQVVATYNDQSTKVITEGYEVSISGTTAVVSYEGATDRIDLTLETPVEPPVLSTDFELKLGAQSSYTVEAGQTVDIPVYFITADGVTDKLGTLQTYVVIPEGFTAEVVAGSLGANALSVDAANGIVKAMGIIGDGYTNDTPAFTIKFTAPATAGEYAVAYSTAKKYATKLYNRETLEKFDAARYTLTETAITVVAGQEPPVPEKLLVDITVNAQTPITIPVGADAVEVVKAAITGVSAVYSDNSVEPVENYEVTVEGNVATVTYEGKSKDLELIIEEPPVDTEMIIAAESVTVPYGTEDVQAYLESILAKVTIKDSKGGERTETATVTYDESGVATVAFGDFTAEVAVEVIVLEGYTAATADGANVIVVPYDVEDVVAYIATKVAVVGNLSDGNTINVTEFEVVVEETIATIMVGEEVAGEFTVEYTEPPVAAIVGIEVNAEGIVVPYGTEDIVAYITSVITVNTVDEDGEKAPTTAFTVEAVDGVATVTYTENTEFTATVNYDVETAVATATVEEIEIPYTSAEDVAGYIAANVKFAVDYSNNTADETDIVVTAADIVAVDGVAVVTVKAGLTVEIAYTIEAAPEYEVINEVADAYGITDKVLVQIENVADGKVVVINGLQATYFGNGKFAALVDAAYTVEVVDAAEMPAVAAFGKLHAEKVTAFDALVTNDAALQKPDIAQFADVQNYLIADINGNGEIEAADALAVNKYSLFGADADVTTWVD